MPCPILPYLVTGSLCLLIAFIQSAPLATINLISFSRRHVIFMFHNSSHLQPHGCFVGSAHFAGSVLTETSQTKTSLSLTQLLLRRLVSCVCVCVCVCVWFWFWFFLACQFMLSVFILTFRMMSDESIILFICNNAFFFFLFNFCVYQELYKIYCSSSKRL